MNTKKKLFTGVLGLATLFGCFGACIFSNSNIHATEVNAETTNGHTHDDITFKAWTFTDSLPTSGSYYLTTNIEVPYSSNAYASTLTGNLDLCLNGNIIRIGSSNYNGPSAFKVSNGYTLNIFDCKEETPHYYTYYSGTDWAYNPTASSGITLDEITPSTPSGTTIVMIPGGAIVDASNNRNQYGGAIQVDGINSSSTKLTIHGGNIIGNYCGWGGGAIYAENGGHIEINDGRILGNCGWEGGGIFAGVNSSLTINGGLIGYNVAHTSYGGGFASYGTVIMNGGSISNNKTKTVSNSENRSGGGAFIVRGTFTLNDGVISNNYSDINGGGVYVNDNGTFTMKGGTITANTAAQWGGGIQLASNSKVTIYDGVISLNTASKYGGGGINNDGALIIEDGLINNNYCGENGGGIGSNSGSVTINGGIIQNNTAKLWGGGIQTWATFTMNGGSFLNNSAQTNGGGGINSDGTTVINGGTVKSNSCAGEGKQIRCGSNKVTIKDYLTIDCGSNDLYGVSNNTTKTKLVLNEQGGIGGDGYIDAIYNQQIPNLTAIPIKTGYTFNGYYTGTNGTGTKYYNADGGRAFTNNWNTIVAEINLYAYWTANSYSVALDTQGGTGGSTSIAPTYDAEMPEMTLPTREYCDFGGYFTESNGKGTQYYNADGTSARNWDIDLNTTLYAYWTITLENFSTQFIKITDGFCDNDGKIEESTKSTLKASFDLLSDEDIASFKILNPVTGIRKFPPEQIVLNAKSRYCYLISDWKCDDFLGLFNEEELKALMHRGSIVSLFNDGEDGTSIILVASLSILTITTISAYILFRKQKEE